MWQCSRQHDNREEAKFCAKCGEKRVVRVLCQACAAVLEPDDVFCTSCGHKRDAQPAAAPVQAPEPAPVPVATTSPEPPAAPTVAPKAEPPGESFSFSFGGTTIESVGPESKAKAPSKAAGSGGRNPFVTAILSFVVFAVLLGAALYFLSR
jgi:hypothetical protein